MWLPASNHRSDRATQRDSTNPPTPRSLGAAPTGSPTSTLPPQTRDLPGFAFAPAGSSRPSLQRRALLGRRPDLGRLSSAGAQAGSRTRVSLSALIFPFLQPKLGLDAPLGLFHSAFSFTSGPSAPSSLLDPFLHPQ